MPAYITEYPQFFTATNLEWKKLLQPDKYKDIIINSFRFLVEDKRIKLYAFVIMPNHIHLIWQMQPLIHPEHAQRDFLKYTAQQIKHDLRKHHPAVLAHFRVFAPCRKNTNTHRPYFMKQALITGDFFLIIGINLIRLLVEENTSNGVKANQGF